MLPSFDTVSYTMSYKPTTNKQRWAHLPFRGVENDNHLFLPLDPASRDIRFLRLHAGANDAPIECSLGHTVLDQLSSKFVPYLALSYCWGDTHDTVNIDLGFPTADESHIIQKFRITRNLHAALLALRSSTESRILWIDAICISQDDPKEKTHQVGLLSLIFSYARDVVVWLGEEDRDSNIIMRAQYLARAVLLDQVDSTSKAIPIDLANEELVRTWWKLFIASATEDEDLRIDIPSRHEDAVCKALYDSIDQFLQRPWFRRIWVFQEVLLAPRRVPGEPFVMMVAGKSAMIWSDWAKLARLCYKAPCVQTQERRNLTWFNGAWYKPTLLRGQANYAYYFDRTRKFLSTDPRDKLFALLHLAKDTHSRVGAHPHFAPDYEKSLSTIVLELASHGIVVPMMLRTSLINDDGDESQARSLAIDPGFTFELLYPPDPYASFEFYDKDPTPFVKKHDASVALPYNATVLATIAHKSNLSLGRSWCKDKGLPRLHRTNRIDWILDELSRACRPLVSDKDENNIKRNILAMIGVDFSSDPGLFSRSSEAGQIENSWFWKLAFGGSWTPRNAYGAPQFFVTTDNRLLLGSNEGQPGDYVVGTPENITIFLMAADKQQRGQRARDYRFAGSCTFYPDALDPTVITGQALHLFEHKNTKDASLVEPVQLSKAVVDDDMFEDYLNSDEHLSTLQEVDEASSLDTFLPPIAMQWTSRPVLESNDLPDTANKSRMKSLRAIFKRQSIKTR